MVQILIPSSQQKQCKNGRYTAYNIEIYLSGKCYKVDRRYSEFYDLHRILKKNYHLLPSNLPPKKVNNLNKKLIEQRRTSLEKYLQNLLKTIGLNKIQELNEFLSLPAISTQQELLKKLDQTKSSIFKSYLTSNDQPEFHDFNFHQCMIGFKNDYLFSIDHDLLSYLTNSLSTANSVYSDSSSNKSSNYETNSTTSCMSSSSSTTSGSLPDIVLMGSLDAIYTNRINY